MANRGKPATTEHSVVASVVYWPWPSKTLVYQTRTSIQIYHSPRHANRTCLKIQIISEIVVRTKEMPLANVSIEHLGYCGIIFYRTDMLERRCTRFTIAPFLHRKNNSTSRY
jgi:hypothetical protein